MSSRRDDADYKDTASLLSAQAKPAAAVDMTPRGGFGFDAELAAALTSTRSPAPQALALAAPTAPKSLDPFVKVFADDAPIVSPAAVPTTLLTERSGRFPKPKAPIGPLPSLDGVIRSPLADVGLACSALVKPMQTVEEARLGVQPGDPTSMSGKAGSTAPLTGIVGLGTGLDLATIANSIKSYEFDESEWNERWQRLSEKPAWSFEKAVEKAVAMSAFVGKFNSLSRTIVETLVDEMALPFHLKSIKPMEGDYADPGPDGATSLKPGSPVVYYSNGLLFRVIPADDESQHISRYSIQSSYFRMPPC